MRIIFTDKLSKMVAHYENLRDTIYELNTSFGINTSWDSGEGSVQYHRQGLLAEKTLSVNLNDISSLNEVRASRYLTLKNNKITKSEEQQDIDKLGKLYSDRKAYRRKWLTTLCLSGRRMCITWCSYVRATWIDLYRNDFATTTQLQVACMPRIPKPSYLTFNLYSENLFSSVASYHLSHMLQ